MFFDIGIAAAAFKPPGERTLGDRTVLPAESEPAGRIVIGVYIPTTSALLLYVCNEHGVAILGAKWHAKVMLSAELARSGVQLDAYERLMHYRSQAPAHIAA